MDVKVATVNHKLNSEINRAKSTQKGANCNKIRFRFFDIISISGHPHTKWAPTHSCTVTLWLGPGSISSSEKSGKIDFFTFIDVFHIFSSRWSKIDQINNPVPLQDFFRSYLL
jgi:hypothetical protein